MSPGAAPRSALELYSGLGGFAVAAGERLAVKASIDVDRGAVEIAAANLAHPHLVRNLESVDPSELAGYEADVWWLSPPCQPFTRRGRGRDDEDPRTRSLLRLITAVATARPRAIAVENVPPFQQSRTRRTLLATLARAGYEMAERVLCPTELGVPNRRRRYYLAASRDGTPSFEPVPRSRSTTALRETLDPAADLDDRLRADPDVLARYHRAIDRVDRSDDDAVASTFTSAYGRSPVRSGSYLRCPDGGWRHFAPREILRLLGFPETYVLPPGLTLRRAWHLCGNSVSVPAVRIVLAALGISRA